MTMDMNSHCFVVQVVQFINRAAYSVDIHHMLRSRV